MTPSLRSRAPSGAPSNHPTTVTRSSSKRPAPACPSTDVEVKRDRLSDEKESPSEMSKKSQVSYFKINKFKLINHTSQLPRTTSVHFPMIACSECSLFSIGSFRFSYFTLSFIFLTAFSNFLFWFTVTPWQCCSLQAERCIVWWTTKHSENLEKKWRNSLYLRYISLNLSV